MRLLLLLNVHLPRIPPDNSLSLRSLPCFLPRPLHVSSASTLHPLVASQLVHDRSALPLPAPAPHCHAVATLGVPSSPHPLHRQHCKACSCQWVACSSIGRGPTSRRVTPTYLVLLTSSRDSCSVVDTYLSPSPSSVVTVVSVELPRWTSRLEECFVIIRSFHVGPVPFLVPGKEPDPRRLVLLPPRPPLGTFPSTTRPHLREHQT